MKKSALVVAVAIALWGCRDAELTSQWRGDRDIWIDGTSYDWANELQHSDELHVDFAVMNDDDFLYIALATTHPDRQRQIMAGGLTLWFDVSGERAKTHGLRFPLGLDQQTWESLRKDQPSDEDEIDQRLTQAFGDGLDRVALLRFHGDEGDRIEPEQLPGLEVAASRQSGSMLLEWKIPLEYVLGSDRELRQVSMGIETKNPPRPAMGREGGGRRDGGSGGPPPSSWGVRPGVPSRQPAGPPPEGPVGPLDEWVTLTLAGRSAKLPS